MKARALYADRSGDKPKIVSVIVTKLREPTGDRERDQCMVKTHSGVEVHRIVDLVPVAHRAALEAWTSLEVTAIEAMRAADEAFDAIPRHDAASLSGMAQTELALTTGEG